MSFSPIKFNRRPKRPTCRLIKEATAIHYHLDVEDLEGMCREKRIARPRQIAYLLCQNMAKKSLNDIGVAFGNRDHTTIMKGIAAYKRREDEDEIESYEMIKFAVETFVKPEMSVEFKSVRSTTRKGETA